GGAVAATLALLAAAYVAVVWWESRDAGPALLPPPSFGKSATPITFGQRLGALRSAVLVRGWPPLAAAAALAGLNVAAYLADHPIGVTGELAAWADRAAGLAGLEAPTLLGADLLAGCNLVLEHLGLVSDFTMLDGGLIVGALLAALLAGEFKLRAPRQRRRYVQSLGGGALMGYGAGVAVGCTLGAFFSAVPSLGLNGWAFGLSLLAGAGLGTRIIKRIA
ncbi:MAG TPA: YeeE/YedE thiosulfate transporter family protein, partial [Chloroflexota bacterium]